MLKTLTFVVSILLALTATADAAVTIHTFATWQFGTIRCWLGDGFANTIVDPDTGQNKLDCLIGHKGADVLRGGAGPDRIDAQSFDDVSSDRLHGGSGVDRFYVGPGWGLGDPRIDRIMDFQPGEIICSTVPFVSWRRVNAGTGPGDRYIVVKLVGGEVAIAWVKALGDTKAATVLGACNLLK